MSDESYQVPPPHPEPIFAPPTAVSSAPGGSVGTATPPAPAPASPPRKSEPIEAKDSPREIIETIVFVIVLVLLLKSFVAEAFVIPTGSMAETLYGYQKKVVCPECRYTFPVNSSSEVEPPRERRTPVTECICPNCRLKIDLNQERNPPRPETGDRVLVDKSLYDLVEEPSRFDVVVFKYPKEPQKEQVPMNYIKRLVGQPGETIAIYGGDLYRTTDLTYSHRPPPSDQDDLRQTGVYKDDPEAHKLFGDQRDRQFERKIDNKGFEIIRKSPDKCLALKRIVYDNDFPAGDLHGKPPRWSGDADWKPDNAEQPRRFEHAGSGSDLAWLNYRHILRNSERPQLVTDFTGYNGGNGKSNHRHLPPENWVGDLMLECTAIVAQPTGRLTLDLAKGVDRFEARWDVGSGVCTLVRLTDGKEEELDSRPTNLKKAGTFELRFANFDERLTVWINGKLVFGDGVSYKPSKDRGPYENDLKPARIGTLGGAITIDHLRLWRDTYYTVARSDDPGIADAELGDWSNGSASWENPAEWDALRNLPHKTLYVQPGHYLCMGDNSPESSDGRAWGLVPRRLMLGRALLVYYPLNRAGPIR